LDFDHRLRHLPFFEEIATLEEGDAARSATAGLLVMRLVDAWIDGDQLTAGEDSFGIRSVVSAVEEVNDGTPIKAILLRTVDALQSAKPDIHSVITPLMAYARALEYDAKWSLAADVYVSVLRHLHPGEDSDASIAAHLRLGQCFRQLGDMERASSVFEEAFGVATSVGDMVGALRARIGEAQIASAKGNIPRAENILDETIERAIGPEMRDVRSRALHDRSNVAFYRRDYELAVQLAYSALEISQAPSERDRILGDIALGFMELGVYTAARDAYLVLTATAQEQYARWVASLNLMEISAKTGVHTSFELYRKQLESQPLPPHMATAFHLASGSGFRRFGQENRAREHYQRALDLASAHGFNQYLFDAEEALLRLDEPLATPRSPAELTLDTEEVANAIRELREAAGV
jgi:tetratricopeptide (TPR) repeat protein